MSKHRLRERQRRVAKDVLAKFKTSGVPEGVDELVECNAAFRRAGLPEINDPFDLICLINDDRMDPESMRLGIEELLSLVGIDAPASDATIGELAGKIGTDEQVEALVEKHVAKRRGCLKEQ